MNSPEWVSRYLHPDEPVIAIVYRHWVGMFGTFAALTCLAAWPVAVGLNIPQRLSDLTAQPLVGPATVLGASLYYLGLLLFMLIRYVDYHLDFWILTSERLISVEQQNLFNRRISEHELIAIQDVTSHVTGLLGSVLNFGKIEVRTASERDAITISTVPRPHNLRHHLYQLVEQQRMAVEQRLKQAGEPKAEPRS